MTKLDILKSRHSVRSFTEEPIPADIVKNLKAELTMTNTHEQGLKFRLVLDDPEPLKGFSKSYGIFENPRNYMAAVVDMAAPDVMERAGYFAERFVIKAVQAGLGTCYVGGTYKESAVKVQLRAGEKVLFLVLLGYPQKKGRLLGNLMAKVAHRKSMKAEDFFVPSSELATAKSLFPMLGDGLEAVACAPSSLNKRPVRLTLKASADAPCEGVGCGQMLCAEVDGSNPKNLIDLGIAKFNFNFATATECEWGNGSRLTTTEK